MNVVAKLFPDRKRQVEPDHSVSAQMVGRYGWASRAAPWRSWYKTKRWQDLRLRVFMRDMFTCQMPGCGRLDGNTSRLVCDHKVPHRGDERRFWDETNLETLCKPCHDALKQEQEQSSLHQRGVWD